MTDTPHIPPEVEAKLDEILNYVDECTKAPDMNSGNKYPLFKSQRAIVKHDLLTLFAEHSAERERLAVMQSLVNVWANYDIEVKKRDLSSDNLPKGARKMTDKEILTVVIAQEQSKLSTTNKEEAKDVKKDR